MEKGITFVGLDAHKVAILVAMLLPGRAVAVLWECANEKASVRRMVKAGDRIKTDRRDARKLPVSGRDADRGSSAEGGRRGGEGSVPGSRGCHEDLVRSRHRLRKLLLRRGWQWLEGRKAWSKARSYPRPPCRCCFRPGAVLLTASGLMRTARWSPQL